MTNFNFISKAVIVATIAVISFSALETNAETIDLTQFIDIEIVDEEVIEFVQNSDVKQDVNCLARNIYYESRGEPIEGQEWVAWVTINRANHSRYPSTICNVVHQCNRNNVCQFSWVSSNRNARPRDQEAWERSVSIAVNVILEDVFNENADPTNGAIMFHANYVSPRWRHSYERVDQIGAHIFYRE